MDKLQFLIDWYNREEDRKSSVENSLNIPIGILTILFAMHFFLVKEFDFVGGQWWEKVTLVVCILISALSSLIAGFFIFKSYHNFPKEYRYRGIPYPSQLLNHEKELIEFYRDNAHHYGNILGEDKFKEYLQNKLAEHIDANAFNNDEKYRFLNIAKTSMFISVITLLIAFAPFLINFFSRSQPPQQVEIVNINILTQKIEQLEKQIQNLNTKNSDFKRPTSAADTTAAATRQADTGAKTNDAKTTAAAAKATER